MMNPTNFCFRLRIEAMLIAWLSMQLVCGEGDDHHKAEMGCIEMEKEALLEFKAAVVDDYGLLSSWNHHSDCCQWKRVRCSNQTGHVSMLHLRGDVIDTQDDSVFRTLTGKIPTSLVKLHQLRYLDLSWNDFSDTHIPEFFGSMTNLRYLDLSSIFFAGEIPTQFGSLSHLRYLNLSWNLLEGSIPSELGKLSSLQYLDLKMNSLKGAIPPQLGNLTKLRELYLGPTWSRSLKISGRDDGWLSNLNSLTHLELSGLMNLNLTCNWLRMIGDLPKLRHLVLLSSSLSDHFLLSLCPSKFNFSASLSVLDLSLNSFTPPVIFQWLSNVTSNLVELNLGMSLLHDSTMSEDFGIAMNSLERLELFGNGLQRGDLKSFTNSCTLRSLHLASNNLAQDFPSTLHNLSAGCLRHSLQDLDLSLNQITGTLTDLSIFPSLKRLDLSSNRLSGRMPEEILLPSQLESLSIRSNSLEGGIPKTLGDACTLSLLDLSNNSLSQEFPVIIDHLSGCARYSLKGLYLGMNQINGTVSDLSMFLSLKSLHLAENKLHGEIPKHGRFPFGLEELHLSSNNLEGVITNSHFANMSNLKRLDLSGNSIALVFSQNWVPPFQLETIKLGSCQLGQAFPRWLETQNKFYTLNISHCGISDIVPKWFWDKFGSQNLRIMDISHNHLKGTIPNSSLRNFDHFLTLGSNEFEGPIPPFLRGAVSLDLSKNKFSDCLSFVCAAGTSEKLDQLDLSYNLLSGQIPDCWSHFKSLAYLDLSHNKFSGKIPTSMGSLVELQALLLRNNSLSQEIPSSIKSCTQLSMLDLEENELSGHIPSWLGSTLQKLQVLSLRRNHFFGSLPSQLCSLKHILFLDLSSNNLSGQIPRCFNNFISMAQNTPWDESYHYYEVDANSNIWYDQSFDLNALLIWKGAEQMFNNNLLFLLRSIDLSNNQLSGEIPAEIEDLLELVSLNLSRNNLSGQIPSKIGRLTSLEFLDLSRNQLHGPIPSSLTQIDRLTMLDVSHNHLSGEIPSGTQLQSFSASNYEDNPDLCGKPLTRMCVAEGEPPQEPTSESGEDENMEFTDAFYKSMGIGFAIGFWGVFGSILVKRSWRHAYFRFLNNLADNIYVKVTVKVAKYKRGLRGGA